MGANFDVDKLGEELNIDKNRRVKYIQDETDSIKRNFEAINRSVSSYRIDDIVDNNWSENI